MAHHGYMRLPPLLLTVLLLAGCAPAAADGSDDPGDGPSVDAALTSPEPSLSLTATPPISPAPASSPAPSSSSSSSSSPSGSAPVTFSGEALAPDGSSSALSTSTLTEPAPVGAFVLGDSISLSIAPDLSRLGYPVTGRVGQSANAEFLQAQLSTVTAQQAPAWVIVLGTNNRGDTDDIARLDEWLRTIHRLRSGKPRQHVYWVTPHRPAEYDGGLRNFDLGEFNAALKEAADQRRWLDVIDFTSAATAHPEWFAQDGARLHPGVDGQAALIDLIAGPDAPLADQSRAITTLTWPTPTPEPEVADEEPMDAVEFTNE